MNKLTLFAMFGTLICISASPLARADWQADMVTTHAGGTERGGFNANKIYVGKSAVRLDSSDGKEGPMSVILSHESKTTFMLMHSTKTYREIPHHPRKDAKKDYWEDAQECFHSGHVGKCLEQKHYTKTGTETVDGHPCTIYQDQGSKVTKVWVPSDLGDVAIIRTMTTRDGKLEDDTHFKNIKVGGISASLFTPPSGYHKVDLAESIANMKGIDPAQKKKILEMMKKRQQ